ACGWRAQASTRSYSGPKMRTVSGAPPGWSASHRSHRHGRDASWTFLFSPDERNEAHSAQHVFAEMVVLAHDSGQLLAPGGADGDGHAAARRELVEELAGQLGRRGRHDDRVVGRILRPS